MRVGHSRVRVEHEHLMSLGFFVNLGWGLSLALVAFRVKKTRQQPLVC